MIDVDTISLTQAWEMIEQMRNDDRLVLLKFYPHNPREVWGGRDWRIICDVVRGHDTIHAGGGSVVEAITKAHAAWMASK